MAKLWTVGPGFYWGSWKYSYNDSYQYNWLQTTYAQANCGNC